MNMEQPTPGRASAGLGTVLYVGRRLADAMLLQSLCADIDGLAFLVVSSGKAALGCDFAVPPAVLLIDLDLPDGDGSELLHGLRARPTFATTPAVALAIEEGTDLSTTSFQETWIKPLDRVATLDRLRRLCARDVDPGWARPTEAPKPVGTMHAPPAVTVRRFLTPFASRYTQRVKAHAVRSGLHAPSPQELDPSADADDRW